VRTDSRGLAITCDDDAARAAIDDFAHRIVRVTAGAEAVLAAAERFADVPMLQLDAATLHLFGQSRDDDREAMRFLTRAEVLAPRMLPREARLDAALRAWQRHDFSVAAARFEAITAEWPDDLLAAKLAEFLYYVLGQQHEGPRFRAHVERLLPRHADDPDVLAMLAFARELCGDTAGAEDAATRALTIAPQTPWADHALSHAWIRRGAVEPAIAHLSAALPSWAESNRVIWVHNAWHLALHQLERLDVDAVQRLYTEVIWRPGETLGGIALDAIALHWRAELAGLDSAPDWAAIADRVTPRAAECFMPFINAQVAYALARAGREAPLRALRDATRAEADRDTPDARRAWARVGRALVEASVALAIGDASRGATLLDPVMDEITVVGGSDAQCDLFRLAYARALTDSGRRAEARAFLATLWGTSARTPLEARWIERLA
jgi:tetratricopeptide (TPR) repeat protein